MNLIFEPGDRGIYIKIFIVQVIDLINQEHITYRKHEGVVWSSPAIA
jgi:hypothetical protein